MRANLLLKYGDGGGGNSGHWAEQQADLLFIVLSHGHVFGAPYPVLGKVQLAGRTGPLAGAGKRAMNEVFLKITGLWGDIFFPSFVLPCRRWGRAITRSRPFCRSRTKLLRGTHRLQGWSRRCSPNMADTNRAPCRVNRLCLPDRGIPSRPTLRTQVSRPTSITITRAGTAMACLRAPGPWIRSLRPCVWRDYLRRPCIMRSNPSLWLGAQSVHLWRRTHLFCLT